MYYLFLLHWDMVHYNYVHHLNHHYLLVQDHTPLQLLYHPQLKILLKKLKHLLEYCLMDYLFRLLFHLLQLQLEKLQQMQL